MQGLGTVFWKDMRLLYRDPLVAVLLIVVPLIMIVFVSYAFEGVLKGDYRLDLPVVDLDHTASSRALIDDLRTVAAVKQQRWDSEQFTTDDAVDAFGGGRRAAVLVVPKGFAASQQRGERISLRLYIDPAQQGVASMLASTVQGRLQLHQFVTTAVAMVADASGQGAADVADRVQTQVIADLARPQIAVETRGVRQGESLPSPFEQTVPGFTLMFSVFLAAAVSSQITIEKAMLGTWERTLMSPVRRPVVALGAVLAALTVGVIQTVLLFAIGRIVFGMELGGAYLGLGATILLFQLMPAGLGLLLAGWTDNLVLQNNLVNLSVMLMAFLGGAVVPLFLLPHWMQFFSRFTPHYWAMQSLQDLMFRGRGMRAVAPNLGLLAVFGLFPLMLGLLRFQFQRDL